MHDRLAHAACLFYATWLKVLSFRRQDLSDKKEKICPDMIWYNCHISSSHLNWITWDCTYFLVPVLDKLMHLSWLSCCLLEISY